MSPYEITHCLDFEMSSDRGLVVHTLKIDVRIWHEDGYGMCAETKRYQITGRRDWIIPGGDPTTHLMDQYIANIIADEYTDEILDGVRDSNPVFYSLDFDSLPITQQEFQDNCI